ncbi:uncharacterized protein LOC100893173 [Strongylocentrotus purpuratus]|uniref:Interferon-induced transmembrane protein n=1 Tax=Strongylocentrotus purpuratus TaxID=7668 RepID=A0A7M7GHU4_STRPU|nr:uncharacterized protein LOC100893173 [Strongylocentrotus purpuratus]
MEETKVNPYDPSTDGTNVETKVNPYDPSTNGTNGTYVPPTNPTYDPSTNVAYGDAAYGNAAYGNAAYNNAGYPAGPTAPMDGSAPPAYNPAPMVQPMTVGVPVTTMITRQGLAPPRPQSFIIHNVLMLLFCCCIFGIIGVVKGSQVDSFYIQGNYDAANAASLSAKKWFNWGLIVGVVVYVVAVVTWMILIFS